MKVESIEKTREVASHEHVARYTEQDIKGLIIRDLEDKGYRVVDVVFQANGKYEYDAWGMNRRFRTYLDGATALVELEEENEK